jgi:hypothetical protein
MTSPVKVIFPEPWLSAATAVKDRPESSAVVATARIVLLSMKI